MKNKLVGKVNLGERIFETVFESTQDFLRSDYMLYRDTRESYKLFYRDEPIEINDDLSFTEIEEAIHNKMNIIDKKLG